jgi:coenzyme F420 hydrogenase subunit beta
LGRVDSIQDVVRYGLCVSCGACVSAAPPGTIRMVFDDKRAIFVPEIIDANRASGKGIEFRVCPGKGLPINEIAEQLYSDAPNRSFKLGLYRTAMAAHSNDERIIKNAASGGLMTEIARYLMDKNIVDGVTASRFVYGPKGPRTESFIARTFDDLLAAQGSKYCPTTTNVLVHQCVEAKGQYLFIGTPCQVAALRLATRENSNLAKIFPYTMANFCGGFHNFRQLEDLITFDGIDPAKVEYFRFRRDGQPGSMFARTTDGRTISASYPDYLHRSDVPKHKRCSYCVDATGELADFACGDAWIDRLLRMKQPWSIILTRSYFAEQIVNELISAGRVVVTPVSFEEICESQRKNLTSKKLRQYKRMRISHLLGITMPEWDVQLPRGSSTYLREARVLFGKTRLGQHIRKIRNAVRNALKPKTQHN